MRVCCAERRGRELEEDCELRGCAEKKSGVSARKLEGNGTIL